MTDTSQIPPAPVVTPADEGGVPVWLPLAAMLIALLFAAFIATRICPTLSALVSPPEPVLPPGAVLQSHESKGTEDSWLYKTTLGGCEVAQFYEKAFGVCIYDPSAGCGSAKNAMPGVVPNQIAECSGNQAIAQYHIAWRAYITSQNDASGETIFRVYREVG